MHGCVCLILISCCSPSHCLAVSHCAPVCVQRQFRSHEVDVSTHSHHPSSAGAFSCCDVSFLVLLISCLFLSWQGANTWTDFGMWGKACPPAGGLRTRSAVSHCMVNVFVSQCNQPCQAPLCFHEFRFVSNWQSFAAARHCTHDCE